ncbi:hypothetical protein THIOM_002558 [Candidatus Thiomargarita nelsonii]|uniref:Uncharacterized protein n=1 Tax=Candidatus Thiomargarita nelsonii TaxID=1003181 RepID=A0A176S0X6_9GAMM|nr:hypothetical protein THIOM_002558 [Candidatus Thiomargarita nelsonii]
MVFNVKDGIITIITALTVRQRPILPFIFSAKVVLIGFDLFSFADLRFGCS